MKKLLSILSLAFVMTAACAQDDNPFNVEEVFTFNQPWALAFLPDGRILVTEKAGNLRLIGQDGSSFGTVPGVPNVDYYGQGGLGDVVLHPDFEDNNLVYLSYVEGAIGNIRGAAVARGVLELTERRARLTDVEVIWRQYPKMLGFGHYGHRVVFDDDGYLWITSGDRQKFTPSQDMQSTIGKVVRLYDDGSVPDDNPFVGYDSEDAFVDDEGVYSEIWSLGHRNPLGIAFDMDGQLWVTEHGPRGGDELNLIKRGANYGYPVVSDGEHYDGRPIPNHDTRPEFATPAISWTPVIAPGNMITYTGDRFADLRGDLLISGLSTRAIIHIEIDGESATEVARYPFGQRVRSVNQGPDGNLWVLEDTRNGEGGRLLKLTPK
ncbi:MAG: PQQ-dependent sugar dehydrogenase [Pseudomonadota bacterium]